VSLLWKQLNYELSSIGLQGGDRNTQNLMAGALIGAARSYPTRQWE